MSSERKCIKCGHDGKDFNTFRKAPNQCCKFIGSPGGSGMCLCFCRFEPAVSSERPRIGNLMPARIYVAPQAIPDSAALHLERIDDDDIEYVRPYCIQPNAIQIRTAVTRWLGKRALQSDIEGLTRELAMELAEVTEADVGDNKGPTWDGNDLSY